MTDALMTIRALAILVQALLTIGPASAQGTFPGVVNPHQTFTPPEVNPPVAVPITPPIVGPAAPAIGFPGLLPPATRAGTFGERATSCMHQGASQGVAPADIGPYTRACAN